MKLLGYGSEQFRSSTMLEAFEIAKRRRLDESHETQNEEMEEKIEQLYRASYSYEIFKTNNAYNVWIGEQKFTYHDELSVELITNGLIYCNII